MDIDMKKLVLEGKQYNTVETEYIIDRLNDDSRMTVYDLNDGKDVRVFICRVSWDGIVYVKKINEDDKPSGIEYEVKTGYYISGCEYAELVI